MKAKYTRHAEGRFCDTAGYLQEMNLVLRKFQQETGTKASEYDKVVLVAQNAKLQNKIASKFGIGPEKMVDTLLLNAGDTGVAQALLGLVHALEYASAGEKILVVDYGNGASAFSLTVTENISKLAGKAQIQRYLETRAELDSYARFLSWRRLPVLSPAAPLSCPLLPLRPGVSRISICGCMAASVRSAVRLSIPLLGCVMPAEVWMSMRRFASPITSASCIPIPLTSTPAAATLH